MRGGFGTSRCEEGLPHWPVLLNEITSRRRKKQSFFSLSAQPRNRPSNDYIMHDFCAFARFCTLFLVLRLCFLSLFVVLGIVLLQRIAFQLYKNGLSLASVTENRFSRFFVSPLFLNLPTSPCCGFY